MGLRAGTVEVDISYLPTVLYACTISKKIHNTVARVKPGFLIAITTKKVLKGVLNPGLQPLALCSNVL